MTTSSPLAEQRRMGRGPPLPRTRRPGPLPGPRHHHRGVGARTRPMGPHGLTNHHEGSDLVHHPAGLDPRLRRSGRDGLCRAAPGSFATRRRGGTWRGRGGRRGRGQGRRRKPDGGQPDAGAEGGSGDRGAVEGGEQQIFRIRAGRRSPAEFAHPYQTMVASSILPDPPRGRGRVPRDLRLTPPTLKRPTRSPQHVSVAMSKFPLLAAGSAPGLDRQQSHSPFVGLEVAGGAQGELADGFSGVTVQDADMQAVGEQGDGVPARRRARPMWCGRISRPRSPTGCTTSR